MYLKNIFIENMGAIEKFSLLEDDLFLNGKPKPIILLGRNGTGKTTLVSSIVDALYELSSSCFSDVLPKDGIDRKYFKVSGARNIRTGSNYGFSYINFIFDDETLEYYDKNGQFDNFDIFNATNGLISESLQSVKGKEISLLVEEDKFREDFLINSYCYFPSDRYELPYWINKGAVSHMEQFKEKEIFSRKLGRDILVRKSIDSIKNWVLDVFLDTRADVVFSDDGSASTTMDLSLLKTLQDSIKNIESLISEIVQKEIKLNLNFRVNSVSRIKLIDACSGQEFIPSLEHLSAGQSTLLSIFGTIIQYSDRVDIMKSVNLGNIQGIVIIDEIDLHLHIELQNKVLPKLIRLFPKVQFIITTHSPFFLSGLSETFSPNEYLMVNMPNGDIIIDTSRFDEFNKAYDLFIDINNNYKYELELIKQKIYQDTKPLIITEGKTDWKHIKSALRNLNSELDIEFLEYEDDIDMGDNKLKTMAENLKSIPNHRKIICIFDRDNKEITTSYGNKLFNDLGNNVFAFCIPKLSDELDKISIEFYYSGLDLKKQDNRNRRLFLGDEFVLGNQVSKCRNYQTKRLNKTGKLTIIDEDVYDFNEDLEMQHSIALPKSDFADYILQEEEPFNNMDFSNFQKIIDVIVNICNL